MNGTVARNTMLDEDIVFGDVEILDLNQIHDAQITRLPDAMMSEQMPSAYKQRNPTPELHEP
jgi:hypothetical protein